MAQLLFDVAQVLAVLATVAGVAAAFWHVWSLASTLGRSQAARSKPYPSPQEREPMKGIRPQHREGSSRS
jgi:hypothetical protein